jgi:hypothetical protein
MNQIERRVSRLEDAAGGSDEPPGQVIQITARKDETADAAEARYRAEHPDLPENTLFIVLVPVSPNHREVRPE